MSYWNLVGKLLTNKFATITLSVIIIISSTVQVFPIDNGLVKSIGKVIVEGLTALLLLNGVYFVLKKNELYKSIENVIELLVNSNKSTQKRVAGSIASYLSYLNIIHNIEKNVFFNKTTIAHMESTREFIESVGIGKAKFDRKFSDEMTDKLIHSMEDVRFDAVSYMDVMGNDIGTLWKDAVDYFSHQRQSGGERGYGNSIEVSSEHLLASSYFTTTSQSKINYSSRIFFLSYNNILDSTYKNYLIETISLHNARNVAWAIVLFKDNSMNFLGSEIKNMLGDTKEYQRDFALFSTSNSDGKISKPRAVSFFRGGRGENKSFEVSFGFEKELNKVCKLASDSVENQTKLYCSLLAECWMVSGKFNDNYAAILDSNEQNESFQKKVKSFNTKAMETIDNSSLPSDEKARLKNCLEEADPFYFKVSNFNEEFKEKLSLMLSLAKIS